MTRSGGFANPWKPPKRPETDENGPKKGRKGPERGEQARAGRKEAERAETGPKNPCGRPGEARPGTARDGKSPPQTPPWKVLSPFSFLLVPCSFLLAACCLLLVAGCRLLVAGLTRRWPLLRRGRRILNRLKSFYKILNRHKRKLVEIVPTASRGVAFCGALGSAGFFPEECDERSCRRLSLRTGFALRAAGTSPSSGSLS